MSRKLSRLNLKSFVLDRLEKQNLRTCKDVLSYTRFDLMNLLGLSNKEIEELLKSVSQACAPNPVTALDIYNKKKECSNNGFIATSLQALDAALHGGLPLGTITEIVGPPSVGKTQFCMLLCLVTALPKSVKGQNHTVIYIDTESTFSAGRLKSMSMNRFPELCSTMSEVAHLMQNVLVYKPITLSESKVIIQELESDIIRKKVKLIIIDSIASLLRKEFGSSGRASVIERNNLLVEYAATLKNLAETFGVAVFVTNQITTKVTELRISSLSLLEKDENKSNQNTSDDETSKILFHDEKQVIPTLGPIWAHCVNTRLMARFISSESRELIIAKSPLASNVSVQFDITKSGIKLTSDIENMSFSSLDSLNLFTKCDFAFTKTITQKYPSSCF